MVRILQVVVCFDFIRQFSNKCVYEDEIFFFKKFWCDFLDGKFQMKKLSF